MTPIHVTWDGVSQYPRARGALRPSLDDASVRPAADGPPIKCAANYGLTNRLVCCLICPMTTNPHMEATPMLDLNARGAQLAYLLEDGGAIPGCRYAQVPADAALIAVDLQAIFTEASGDDVTTDDLDGCMSMVVNSHDNVSSMLRDRDYDSLSGPSRDVVVESWVLGDRDLSSECERSANSGTEISDLAARAVAARIAREDDGAPMRAACAAFATDDVYDRTTLLAELSDWIAAHYAAAADLRKRWADHLGTYLLNRPEPVCPDCARPISLNPSGWWSHDGMPDGCWRLSMDGPDSDPLDH